MYWGNNSISDELTHSITDNTPFTNVSWIPQSSTSTHVTMGELTWLLSGHSESCSAGAIHRVITVVLDELGSTPDVERLRNVMLDRPHSYSAFQFTHLAYANTRRLIELPMTSKGPLDTVPLKMSSAHCGAALESMTPASVPCKILEEIFPRYVSYWKPPSSSTPRLVM